jgi:hydrogenase assembly chaperone HypC/HupF
MCLTIPYKIKKIQGPKGIVKAGSKSKEINLNLLKNLKPGDWILTLHDLAVQKVSALEAKQIINLYKYGKNK